VSTPFPEPFRDVADTQNLLPPATDNPASLAVHARPSARRLLVAPLGWFRLPAFRPPRGKKNSKGAANPRQIRGYEHGANHARHAHIIPGLRRRPPGKPAARPPGPLREPTPAALYQITTWSQESFPAPQATLVPACPAGNSRPKRGPHPRPTSRYVLCNNTVTERIPRDRGSSTDPRTPRRSLRGHARKDLTASLPVATYYVTTRSRTAFPHLTTVANHGRPGSWPQRGTGTGTRGLPRARHRNAPYRATVRSRRVFRATGDPRRTPERRAGLRRADTHRSLTHVQAGLSRGR
jgi:hypothetical protein